MKKKIDISSVASSLRGESVFFPTKDGKPAPEQAGEPQEPKRQEEPLVYSPIAVAEEVLPDTVIPRRHDTMVPSNHDSMVPNKEEEVLETVRKSVKQLGREPATQRLTIDEKQALRDIEYTYSSQSIQTSANEIIRIALNFILADYRRNGKNSVLATILRKLNS